MPRVRHANLCVRRKGLCTGGQEEGKGRGRVLPPAERRTQNACFVVFFLKLSQVQKQHDTNTATMRERGEEEDEKNEAEGTTQSEKSERYCGRFLLCVCVCVRASLLGRSFCWSACSVYDGEGEGGRGAAGGAPRDALHRRTWKEHQMDPKRGGGGNTRSHTRGRGEREERGRWGGQRKREREG